MCEFCKTGTYVKDNIKYPGYKFCPECGCNLDADFLIFQLSKKGNVISEKETTLRGFYNLVKENNLKIMYYFDRPSNEELEKFCIGDVICCGNRYEAFIICQ